MVPDEGIEPPTFGLQNRCSTAELIRHTWRTDDLSAYSGGRKPELPRCFSIGSISPEMAAVCRLLDRMTRVVSTCLRIEAIHEQWFWRRQAGGGAEPRGWRGAGSAEPVVSPAHSPAGNHGRAGRIRAARLALHGTPRRNGETHRRRAAYGVLQGA